jgi:hypothetical protein
MLNYHELFIHIYINYPESYNDVNILEHLNVYQY